MGAQMLSSQLIVFFVATVFLAGIGSLLWKVRQSAWAEGDTNGVKRGIDIGKHHILREVQHGSHAGTAAVAGFCHAAAAAGDGGRGPRPPAGKLKGAG